MKIRRLRDKYSIIINNLYRKNKQFKAAAAIIKQLYEKEKMNFNAKKTLY